MSKPEAKPDHDEKYGLPDPKEVAATYTEVVGRVSRLLAQQMQQQFEKGVTAPADELGIAQAFMDMQARMLANPDKLAQMQMGLMRDYFSLWQHSMLRLAGMPAPPLTQPDNGDNRFKDSQWEDHFLFDFIKQSYLIAARYMQSAVADVEGLNDVTRKKVNFFTRQFVDALSPSNFAHTNPEVLRETVRSNGFNLLKGFNNLLRDIEAGDGQLRVKMTDDKAFVLGENVAAMPGKVVFQNELMQLLQFAPTTERQFRKPLLIIPPWINKYYILDLREKNSFIKWATDQGHSVFCVSWVNPDAKLAEKNFDDYLVEGVLAALDAVEKQTGEPQANVIGYCLGGTLLGTALAYLATKKQKRIASATFFVSLLDFSVTGDLGAFIDEPQIANLEKKMGERGYLEGSEMAGTFSALRANDLIWHFVINNYLMGREPMPFDLLFWNSDSTRMPCKMHSFYLRNMYLKNLLREPGGIELDGVPIDLAKNKAPAYFISTIEDHIAPWKGTYLGALALGGPKRFVLSGSGHIAGVVNPPIANKYGYRTNDSKIMPGDPDQWLAGATQHEGSWWPDWQKWIGDLNSDDWVPARDPAKGKLKALETAPGSYAKFRLDQLPKSK